MPSTAELIEGGSPRRPSGGSSRRSRAATRRRWAAAAYVVAAVAEIVWVVLLSFVLRSLATAEGWTLSWAGLDVAEALAFFSTGWCLIRRDARCVAGAVAIVALLLVDAWLDISTSLAGPRLLLAVGEAVAVEIPVSCLSLVLAVRVRRLSARTRSLLPAQASYLAASGPASTEASWAATSERMSSPLLAS